jgi:hypothetical protein
MRLMITNMDGFFGNPPYSIPSYSPAREWGFASCRHLTLPLTRVAGLAVDVAKAGFASLPASMINISANTPAKIGLAILPPNARVLLDGPATSSRATRSS